MRRAARDAAPVLAALDEVAFGAANILKLRDARPTADEATRRTEAWLRERQVARAGTVLVVTGRGNGSEGGVGVLGPAIERLCAHLKRKGVVATATRHSPGALAVTLAPVHALFEAPARARAPERAPRVASPQELAGLAPATRTALRALAERWLHDLGAPADDPRLVEDEMRRLFARLAPAAPGEAALAAAIRAAQEELDDRAP